jgi:hypothetical protein
MSDDCPGPGHNPAMQHPCVWCLERRVRGLEERVEATRPVGLLEFFKIMFGMNR